MVQGPMAPSNQEALGAAAVLTKLLDMKLIRDFAPPASGNQSPWMVFPSDIVQNSRHVRWSNKMSLSLSLSLSPSLSLYFSVSFSLFG